MPNFLSDPPVALWVSLLLAWMLTAGLYVRYRKRAFFAAMVGLLAALVLLFILSLAFESPREKAVSAVKKMAKAIDENKWDDFAEQVSDNFDAKGVKKAQMKKFFDLAVQYQSKVTVWDFAASDNSSASESQIELEFDAKGRGSLGEVYKHFRVTFVKEGDRYRMKSFTPYNYVEKKVEEPLPGVP